MGPLSAKQHREYLKLDSQQQRESIKMQQDERRKQQLHEIKLQEAAAKANQGIGHKEQMQQVKLKEAGSPLSKPPKMNRQKLGLPSTNPMAGTEMFKQGQHKLSQGTDTVPAMLTPGEAVIPEPAAQNPENKAIIKRMVDEGRQANALRDGAVDVRYSDAPGQAKYHADGTTQVTPSPADLYKLPSDRKPKELTLNNILSNIKDEVLKGISPAAFQGRAVDLGYKMYKNATNTQPMEDLLEQAKAFSRGSIIGGAEPNSMKKYSNGTTQVVPSLAYEHPDVPGSAFMDGTTKVFSRGSSDQANYNNGTYGVVPQQVQQGVGYADGTTEVDDSLGWISNYKTPAVVVPPAPVVVPVAEVPATTATPVYRNTKEIPAVPGVTDSFQQWKNATMGVESNYGNHPKTWEKNNAGAMGLYGLTENTFNSMQKQGMIPKEWKHTDQTQNTQASEVLANDTWKRAGGDPAKASAIWYSGPKAVDAKTGQIKSFKDPKNPEFPDTLKYVDNVKGILSRSEVAPLAATQPTGRELLIAKQDLATSTNKEVRRKAEETLAKANQPIPTLADNRNTIKSEPVAYPTTPVINELERSKELANDTTLSARDRAFFAEEVKRIEGNAFKKVGASEPKNVAQQLTGSPVIGDKLIPPPKEVTPEVVPEVTPTEVPKDEAPSLIQTQPEEANKAIATWSQEKANIIKQFADTAPTVSEKPKEQQSWLAKQIESVFSDTGLFSPSELARFAIVAAGGMLTGGSTGGSLRYAGLDALKSGDARRAQQAEYKKAVGIKTEAAAAQRSKDINKYYDDEINAAEKSGQIKPEYARELRKAVLSGNLSTVESALGDTQNRFSTPTYAAGLPADAKPVSIKQPGHTTKVSAFLSPTSNEYIIFNTDSKGNNVIKRVPTSQYEQVGPTEGTADQARQVFIDKQISQELFGRDPKTNKPLPGSLQMSKQTVVAQLDEWAKEQRRLNLPDDYSYFASTINNALSTAAKSGELKPHVGKLLSMATINTASLTDNDKYIGKDNKAVPSSYIGDAVNSINSYSKSVIDNDKKLTPEQKKDPQTVLRQSRDMMDKAAVKFEAGKKLSPEELADQAVKTGAVKRNDAQYNKIKEAPNSWWSYINYQMAIDKPKKE